MIWFRNILGGQIFWQATEQDGYVFIVRNGLSLAEIPEKYAGLAEHKLCGCGDCGNQKRCLIRATQEEIDLWKSG